MYVLRRYSVMEQIIDTLFIAISGELIPDTHDWQHNTISNKHNQHLRLLKLTAYLSYPSG